MSHAHVLVIRSRERDAEANRWAQLGNADARACTALVRIHARTFYAASRLLTPAKRRAAFALYAFCRIADDIVDTPSEGEAHQRLAALARALDAALDGHADDPILREVATAVHTHDVPRSALHELLDGVARDLHPVHYASWSALSNYCEGVASSVGEMCTHVFGVRDAASRMRAVRYARTLGVAMQLTNILRDVGEDARRGRCYLPADDLVAFDLTPHDVLTRVDLARDERWAPFVAAQIGRARSLYEAARPGIALLAPDAVRCATACATGYAAILDAIESNNFDSIGTRARVGRRARVALLWRAWRTPLEMAAS